MGGRLSLRRASAGDLGYLSSLASDPSVDPYLAPGAGERARLERVMAETEGDGDPHGLFVVELAAAPVGGLALQLVSRNSRSSAITRLMVDPGTRRQGVAARAVRLACRHALIEHGFHRVQAETYGDNLAAQRLFERVGFVREGVRRRAYWRRDQWLDGVLYGMLADELRELDGMGADE